MAETSSSPEMPEFFTVNQVAELFGVHRNTLRRWRLRGAGDEVMVALPGAILYRRSDVFDWLQQASNKAQLEAERLRHAFGVATSSDRC